MGYPDPNTEHHNMTVFECPMAIKNQLWLHNELNNGTSDEMKIKDSWCLYQLWVTVSATFLSHDWL